jgi:glycosyltransferase involved in cell wall biosynthesis
MKLPLVSILIPTWNSAAFLSETIESALSQTWPNVEIIVVDDGSTDETSEVVAPFLSRIQFVSTVRQGVGAARNKAFSLSSGTYIAFLDSDDILLPRKIEIQMALAARHPESGVIVCDAEEFNESGTLQNSLFAELAEPLRNAPSGEITRDFYLDLVRKNRINCPAQTLIPRHVIARIGEHIDMPCADYDFYLRIARLYPVTLHREALVRYRVHSASLSGPRPGRMTQWTFWTALLLVQQRKVVNARERLVLESSIVEKLQYLSAYQMEHPSDPRSVGFADTMLALLLKNPWPAAPLWIALKYWLRAHMKRQAG